MSLPKFHTMDEAIKYIEQLQMLANDTVSINKIVGSLEGEYDTELGELIQSHEPSPLDLIIRDDESNALLQHIQKLSPREITVIKLRYGFDTGRPMTLNEVGTTFRITRERVRQIEATALRKLRRFIAKANEATN